MTIATEDDVAALKRIGMVVGGPGNLSAQYEHTLIITKGEPIVVTRH